MLRSASPLLIRASPKKGPAKRPATSDCVATLGPHSGAHSLGISSDRKFALSTSPPYTESAVWGECLIYVPTKVWDLKTKAPLLEVSLLDFEPSSVAVAAGDSATGSRRIVFSTSKNDCLRVLDISDKNFSHTLQGTVGPVCSLAISADSLHAASSSLDKLQVWDIQASNCIATLESFKYLVQAVAVTADQSYAMLGVKEMQLQLWSLKTGAFIASMHGDHKWMRSVAVTGDERYVVSSNAGDAELKVWRLPASTSSSAGSLAATLTGATGFVKAVTVADDDRIVLAVMDVGGAEQLQMWDMGA